jgi:hypothetical protein
MGVFFSFLFRPSYNRAGERDLYRAKRTSQNDDGNLNIYIFFLNIMKNNIFPLIQVDQVMVEIIIINENLVVHILHKDLIHLIIIFIYL